MTVDPSGGWGYGTSLLITAGSALAGYGIDRAFGGDGRTGLAIGLFAGAAVGHMGMANEWTINASGINWSGVGRGIGKATAKAGRGALQYAPRTIATAPTLVQNLIRLNEVRLNVPQRELAQIQPSRFHLSDVRLGNGNLVRVNFSNTADGVNSDLPVEPELVNSFEGAVRIAGLRHDIRSITVSSTTNGVHSANSRHYIARAIDISAVNGEPVAPNDPIVEALQQAFEFQPGARENFGPAMMLRSGQPYIHGGLNPVQQAARVGVQNAHQNHIHWSID